MKRRIVGAAAAAVVVAGHTLVLRGCAPPVPAWRPAPVVQARWVVVDAPRAIVPAPATGEAVVQAPPLRRPSASRPSSPPPSPPQPPHRGHPERSEGSPGQQRALPEPSSADTEPPRYPVRLPPPGRWSYTLERGGRTGDAELVWSPDGDHYAARLAGRVAGGAALEWTSSGALHAGGIAPARYVERRRPGGAQAANYDPVAGRVTYSGSAAATPLVAAQQDRVSWWLQLAGIVAAEPARWTPGERVVLAVGGVRGDVERWRLAVVGLDHVGETALKLERDDATAPYAARVAVWLAPGRNYLPVRVRLVHGDHVTEWRLRSDLPADSRG